jgi:hypothetical protein
MTETVTKAKDNPTKLSVNVQSAKIKKGEFAFDWEDIGMLGR